jgi:regulator of sigma E protease
MLVTVVSFLIVLSVMVLAHEMGHFFVGRWAGAKVEEFALGFPPRVWSTRRGETDYSINAIPLGGYCRFAGEDNPDVPGGLSALPRLQRALVLVAGVAMNVILAIVIFAFVFVTGYPTAIPIDGVKVDSVAVSSPAESAGLKPGDVILKVDGAVVNNTTALSNQVSARLGQEVSLFVTQAGGAQTTLKLVPRANPPAGQGPLGVAIEQNSVVEKRAYPPLQSLWLGVQQTWRVTAITIQVPVMIIRGLIPAELARPVGPVGVARLVGSAAEAIPQSGFAMILNLMAYLSVNLAIVNILPLPGLDGGRLVFVILEWLRRGKRINPQREAIIHFSGLMLLMGLILVITFFDIVSPANLNLGP